MRRARDGTVPLRAIEFDLLCWIARPQPRLDRARELLRTDLDFAALLRLATDHSVRPALVRALADLAWEGVPAEARVELERFQRLHLVRMLALADELCRTAASLASRGIAFAAFKGATLAVGLHGDLTAREYNDIDLVVPERSMAAAEEVLGGLGYRGVQGDRAFRRAFLAYQRQFAFVRDDLDTTINCTGPSAAVICRFRCGPTMCCATSPGFRSAVALCRRHRRLISRCCWRATAPRKAGAAWAG